MKNLFFVFSFLLTSIILPAQVWEKNLRKINPFPSIQERFDAFEKHRKSHPYTKGNGFKPYAREIDFLLKRSSQSFSFNRLALFLEWEKEKQKKSANAANWIAKGPINTPLILSNGKKRGNGRVNCIAFDPFDEDIIWVGSPAGGLWKSVDGGGSWTTATDNLPVIGVSSIAINPTNPQVMYIVTGDAHAWDTYTIGILKSTDGGVNWNTTGLSYTVNQEERINKVIINPNYPDSIYAATNSNIMLSTDGGTNWSSIGIIGRWRDLEFMPGNPSVIYAAKHSNGGSNIYRSTNGGGAWSIINNGVASSGKDRPLISVTQANPNVIYALYSSVDDSFHGLYKSIDQGNNWTLQSNTPNILGRRVDGTSTGGQSWYDLSLGVSTIDENLVYVGGINLWKSTDGGETWSVDGSSGNDPIYSYMHVDQHAFEFNPLNHIAYAGNDGGIYKWVENLNKWVDISDGLEISQFYKLGLSKSNTNRLIAGAQDNGTEMLTNGIWDAVNGGDGMECAIDIFDDDVLYSEYQYGGMRKSYDGGHNWSNIKPPQVGYDGGWVTPYKIHPNNPLLIVAGYDEIYRSFLGGDVDPFNSWDSISYNVSGGQSVKTIALAPSNQNYIYAATYSTLKVTTNGGASWNSIKSGLPNYNITDVTVSASNPDHLWVTFSGYNSSHKIYESADRGVTWTNITGNNFPGLPVNCIVHQDFTNGDLYVGTDVGVYYKDNSMNDWVPFMTGLPNVIINELEIHYAEGTITAATFGRGVWQSPLTTMPSLEASENSFANFSVFPNPAKNTVFISSSRNNFSAKFSVLIYALTGEKVLEQVLSPLENKINISSLSKGCYVLRVVSGDNISVRKKLIIE